jgi:DNA-binding MarR family transcriptional regulator
MSISGRIKIDPETGAGDLCPEARISSPTKSFGGRQIVDVTNYIPYFLVAINSALSRGASHLYLQMFGIGIVEWRVISMLAIEPRISAARICKVVSLDKSGTSRALQQLLSRGYLSFSASKTDPRRKIWWLNTRGYALHDKILAIALEREKELIEGIKPDDLETFLKVVRIMRRNVDRISDA